MEFTNAEVNVALQEAFTHYLAFLSHAERLQRSGLPRRGKGLETSYDVSTERTFQSRIWAIETSLRYTKNISRRVVRWSNDIDEAYGEVDGETEQYPSYNIPYFLPDGDERSVVDSVPDSWGYAEATSFAEPSVVEGDLEDEGNGDQKNDQEIDDDTDEPTYSPEVRDYSKVAKAYKSDLFIGAARSHGRMYSSSFNGRIGPKDC